jgi:hypothetical protein
MMDIAVSFEVNYKSLFRTGEETAGTEHGASGRERSHELFGRLKAEKVGFYKRVSRKNTPPSAGSVENF